MKVALLLPGYLDSPDYLHMKTFEKKLHEIGFVVERLDPCDLWKTGEVNNYTVSNYIKQIKSRTEYYKTQNSKEIVLIGHSLGAFVSILAGNMLPEITKIIALCSPVSIDALGRKWAGKPFRISNRDLPNDSSKYREFEIPLSFVEDAKKYSALNSVHEIKKPLMIFIAMADTSISPKETEMLVSNAMHPYVVRMQEIGHDFRHSLEECLLVFKEIESFLEKK